MANEDVKVSVIIPVYNIEKYLRQCVDSVLNQTYTNIEVILVDDGSKDSSAKICDEYRDMDNRVKVIHKENGGAATARNIGLANVTGQYIMFVDSDDFWASTSALDGLVRKAKQTNADTICFGYKECYDNGSYGKFVDVIDFNESSLYTTIENMLKCGMFTSSAWTKFIKTEVVINNDIFFTENVTTEDIDWCARVLIHSKSFAVYTDNFYRYRQRAGSVVHMIKYENLEMLANNIKRCLDYGNKIRDEKYLDLYYNYVSYQYITFLKVALLCEDDSRTKTLFKSMKEYRWLLNYHLNKKVKIVYYFNKFLGYNLMFKALKLYTKVK